MSILSLSHLLLDGVLLSFLDPHPDGDVRVPPFFGRIVPLFTVGRNGRVAIIGLAGGQTTTAEQSGVNWSMCQQFPLIRACKVELPAV